MLKRFFLILSVTVLAGGCVGTIKRGVQNNTFYSTYPKLAIKLAPELEYVQNEASNDFTQSTNNSSDHSLGYRYEKFIFVDRLTRKGGYVAISKLVGRAYWSPNMFSAIPHLLDSGHEEHQGLSYQYAIFPVEGDYGGCFLSKTMTRIVGGKKNMLLEVTYYEPIGEHSLGCSQWENGPNHLSDRQQTQLKTFLENNTRNMALIDWTEVDLIE